MPSDRIKRSRLKYQNPYAHLNDQGNFDAELQAQHVRVAPALTRQVRVADEDHNDFYSSRDIEGEARKVLIQLWNNEKNKGKTPQPLSIINPISALEMLGYKVEQDYALGQMRKRGQAIEVGGVIDRENRIVQISPQFDRLVRNFTAAHELGHAMLHQESGLHRDRPLDGSSGSDVRDLRELQADKFASYFLMPRRLVIKVFLEIFGTCNFQFDERRVFALTQQSSDSFRAKYPTRRKRARLLARTEQFNGTHFKSLARIFNVSVEAMAIRIEELDLIE